MLALTCQPGETGPVSGGGEAADHHSDWSTGPGLSSPLTVQVNTNKSEEAKAIMAGREPGSLWPLLLFKPYRWHDVKNEPVSSRLPISEWAHYLPFLTLNLLPCTPWQMLPRSHSLLWAFDCRTLLNTGACTRREWRMVVSALFPPQTDAFTGSFLTPSLWIWGGQLTSSLTRTETSMYQIDDYGKRSDFLEISITRAIMVHFSKVPSNAVKEIQSPLQLQCYHTLHEKWPGYYAQENYLIARNEFDI